MEPEIDVAYSKIVTISSTDSVLGCLEWKQSLGAHWPFLSDLRKVVQRELDIVEYTDPHHEPIVPYTVMLEPGLVVYRIYNGYWYWGRPTPEELRQDFRAISRRIRPDWDLSDPEMRRRWEAGDKDDFFPYPAH
jgi:hypothetical protein